MGWKSWNKADKTLFFAAVLFLLALCLRIVYRTSLLAQGFLFCSEAALVGGIADWFAVTALFKKPLGFPYHTAILPRRRESFIEATVGMVQKEFFAKRKLFHLVREIGWRAMLVKWLAEKEAQAFLAGQLWHYVRRFLLRMDWQAPTSLLAAKLRKFLAEFPTAQLLDLSLSWLQNEQHAQRLLAGAARQLRPKLMAPEVREQLVAILQDYQRQRLQGKSSLFAGLAGLAQAINIVNFDEAAELMQQQAGQVLDELAELDSAFQRQLLATFYERVSLLRQDESFLTDFEQLRQALLKDLPIEDVLAAEIERLRERLQSERQALATVDCSVPALQDVLVELFQEEIARWILLLQTNDTVKRSVDQFLYDMAARSMLQAQLMVGVIVRQVMERMTDEQMNRLVYDKVEPDLLWIRMNGSIVGGGIGFCLFMALLVLRNF
jgi:uncharacterized membrane-anchored protein YjiN (DUF445 family)